MEDYSNKRQKKQQTTITKPTKKNYKKDHESTIEIFQKKTKKRNYANITNKKYVRCS